MSSLVSALAMERCALGSYRQGVRVSTRREVLAIGPDADAGAIPEDQRNAHEDALALFQPEVVSAALLVADVATVFLVGQVVGIIQAHRESWQSVVRVGIPHDRIDGTVAVLFVIRRVFRGPGLPSESNAIRQKLPGLRTGGGGIRIEGLLAIVGLPAAACRHQVGESAATAVEGASKEAAVRTAAARTIDGLMTIYISVFCFIFSLRLDC